MASSVGHTKILPLFSKSKNKTKTIKKEKVEMKIEGYEIN